MLTDRLHAKLEPIMSPPVPNKQGADPSMPVATGLGNLIDRANQELDATNRRLREMIERIAI